MLLQGGRLAAAGGFAAVFESGGFRELITDTAFTLGLEFAPLENATQRTIEQHLDPGLKAENPLDVWGSHDRFEARMEACLQALMQDPNVGAGAFFSNFRDGYFLSEAIYRIVEKVGRETGKPLVLANCYSDLANRALCQRGYADGVAILDGTRESLLAFKHLFAYRDFRAQQTEQSAHPGPASAKLEYWRQTLADHAGNALGESEALSLLRDFAIPVVRHASVTSEAELIEAAAELGYPVVLKTAEPGIHHKSDSAGVFVGIDCQQDLLRHYRDINARLGAKALLSQMVESGTEIALGTVNDRQFGPVVMVAAGGIMVELLYDRVLAMCPVSPAQAQTMLDSLRANQLLKGLRGRPASNRQALIDVIVRLSQLAFALRDRIAEIDINPIIVSADEAIAVDALIALVAPGESKT
jgi:acyl-CoA synthetase (NDP forming)